MKRCILILLAFISLLTVSCDYKEIENYNIADLLYIDVNEENTIELDVKLNIDDTVVSGRGESIAAALEEANIAASNPIYFNHDKIIMIGQNAARHRLGEILQFLGSRREFRYESYIVICESKFDEIIGNHKDFANELMQAIECSKVPDTNMYSLISTMMQQKPILIPGFSKAEFSAAVIQNDTFCEFVNDDVCFAYLAMRNMLRDKTVTGENFIFKVKSSHAVFSRDVLNLDIDIELIKYSGDKTSPDKNVNKITSEINASIESTLETNYRALKQYFDIPSFVTVKSKIVTIGLSEIGIKNNNANNDNKNYDR